MSCSMGSVRRRISPEFKHEEVRPLAEGQKVSQVASDLGVRAEILRRWKQQMETGGFKAFPGHGRVCAEYAELVPLRGEVKRLREERDILRRATAFFAACERRGS